MPKDNPGAAKGEIMVEWDDISGEYSLPKFRPMSPA